MTGETRPARDDHSQYDYNDTREVAAVSEGRLDFGTWERISYGEFDERRRMQVVAKIMGE